MGGNVIHLANLARHEAAKNDIVAQIEIQRDVNNVTTEVTLKTDDFDGKARIDASISGEPNTTVPVPEGYTAVDRATGNAVDTMTLNNNGKAMVEVKTGNGKESTNQTAVYDACQIGNATGCGGNAHRAGYKDKIAPATIYTLKPKGDE